MGRARREEVARCWAREREEAGACTGMMSDEHP